MLSTIDINYAKYSLMSDDFKDEYQFTLDYMKNAPEVKDYFSEKDISDLEFIQVKMMQECIINNDMEGLYEQITSLPQYSQEKLMKSMAYEVILTFKYIVDRVNQITELENEMLKSCAPGDDYTNIVEQVDFSVFPAYYTQMRELADGDITRFEQIKHIKYSDCLVELIYRQKQADFEKLVMRAQMKKP